MSPPDGSNTTLTLTTDQAEEARMRAALGVAAEVHASRPTDGSRQRAGQDSDKPISMVNTRRPFESSDPSRARLATLMDELRAERSERAAAQQALADAQRFIQQLQTRLAHTEIAAAEAFAAEQKARLEAENRLQDMLPAVPPGLRAEKLTEPKKRGRPPGKRQTAKEPEPKPVKWWLPSYKASRVKPTRSKA